MSRPAREKVASRGQTYFVTSQTAERRALFRNERWAVLMQETLQRYQGDSYLLHAYVIMPNHFHLLITPQEALERCVQKIKGGFSFRAQADFGWKFNIWQSGFSDHRIRDAEDCSIHLYYIRHNPIKAGVCLPSEEYPYLRAEVDPIPQRLKPVFTDGVYGGAEAPPLQSQSAPFLERSGCCPSRERADEGNEHAGMGKRTSYLAAASFGPAIKEKQIRLKLLENRSA